MNRALIDNIVQAVLYEGYILYPYRRSTKNAHRWTFGNVFPRAYSEAAGGIEPHAMQVQCLLQGREDTKLLIEVRFLQLVERTVGKCLSDGASFEPVDEIEVAGRHYQSWQEALERTVTLEATLQSPVQQRAFASAAGESVELLPDENGRTAARLVRTTSAIEGDVELSVRHERDDLFQLTVRIVNRTPMRVGRGTSREQALLHSMASTHAVLAVQGGAFISLIDPPPAVAGLAKQCRSIGAWPVLVGEPGETDAMLASPIILYDYPQVAPESPGDLFDGTEIDEILSLRILTLTDEEKRCALDLDPRSAEILARTESVARDQLMRLHGTIRPRRTVQALHIGSAEVRIGDHVRLRPGGSADALDIILHGKAATIVAIEQDYENRIHVAVTIDEDPGADIGAAGKIGHRFYFRPDEIEPVGFVQEMRS